ncbi:MAG: DUF3368 domain-containing protein [Chloroflexia bacterium]|nr:DUF3368 domain-containing protein [Chloroflexia bacterium]
MADSGLHAGEREAISLALERRASYVLCDDRDARLWMEAIGLEPLGCIGILLRAKRLGILPAIKPPLDDLRTVGLYVGDRLYQQILAREGEPVDRASPSARQSDETDGSRTSPA